MLSEYEAYVCRDYSAGYEPSSGSMLKLVVVLTVVLGLGWLVTVGWEEAGASTVSQVQRQT